MLQTNELKRSRDTVVEVYLYYKLRAINVDLEGYLHLVLALFASINRHILPCNI